MPFRNNQTEEDYFLQQALLGDEKGLAYLVHAYEDLAYTVAFKIVGNKEDAEEVVQDGFMKAFGALGNFRRASKFSTWLYRIVYNTAITKLQSRGRDTLAIDERLSVDPYNQYKTDESHAMILAERKKYIDSALNRISIEDRIILTLYYLGEKDIVEICQILGQKKSAVKMRLLRGRKKLKEQLEQLLPGEYRDLL